MSTPPQRPSAAVLSSGELPAESAVAVTPHFLASQTARDVMAAGGNAVDAAIAAVTVLGVVLFDTCGIGGDLFALVHQPGASTPAALNASGRCGSGWSAQALRDEGLVDIPISHPAAVTVPGCVDGLLTLHDRFGSMPFSDLLQPAITTAANGFVVSDELAATLIAVDSAIAHQASAAAFYPEATPASAGTSVTRADLADTLTRIAEQGRAGFYAGETALQIDEATEGNIRTEDFERIQADWVNPIGLQVFGLQGWTMPPNSQGYLALAGAWLFSQLGAPADPENPAYHHALIEAYRSVAWERNDLVADPESSPVQPDELLDPARLQRRLESISFDRVATWPRVASAPAGTAYLCFRDPSGLGVSLIQSNYHGIGSQISAGTSGVFLHDRGAGFNLVPGHPNELTPGRRPLHTLSPTLWTRGEELALLLGTRGGEYQPQLLIQMVAALNTTGFDLNAAQRVPRWIVDGWDEGHTSQVTLEGRFPAGVANGLQERGHQVAHTDDWAARHGPVSVIHLSGSKVEGAADPRVTTSAVANA